MHQVFIALSVMAASLAHAEERKPDIEIIIRDALKGTSHFLVYADGSTELWEQACPANRGSGGKVKLASLEKLKKTLVKEKFCKQSDKPGDSAIVMYTIAAHFDGLDCKVTRTNRTWGWVAKFKKIREQADALWPEACSKGECAKTMCPDLMLQDL